MKSNEEIIEDFDKKFPYMQKTIANFGKENGLTVKDFLLKALQAKDEHYKKELEIADKRWQANEELRDKYDEAYLEGYGEADEKGQKERERFEKFIEKYGHYNLGCGTGNESLAYEWHCWKDVWPLTNKQV